MSPSIPPPRAGAVRLGLRENLGQFALLVVVNAFVGAMVGLERTVLPAMAEHEFQLARATRMAETLPAAHATARRQ